ncbi:dihydrodipicolinate synthase family protein [Afifella sp. IM 167]|uniref:dihydrodipicolinate synthase family protein n=1 Tax=Afifella sp. IM 167 TaxID=2033586 RepID=UPI001CCC6478|nr:dihydrodipicolinate synthase family protein [Afifella sp. IM 167]MBZ8132926.1 dihydrodipicolinate synthase family protein [Afifella sp. IM 167]
MPEIHVPVATPFDEQLEPDAPAFLRHCRTLLASGAHGLAPFGTTSEANSLSTRERRRLLDAILEGGIEAASLMPGTGLCNLPETVELTRQAASAGCRGVLMLPPFYYKGVSEDGLFRHFASVIEAVGEPSLRIYLYHIPPQSQIGISASLVNRLVEAFGPVIAGLKDSSGDWANTQMLILQFPGLQIFSGSETSLLANMRAGGAGAISATANVNVTATRALIDRAGEAEADQLQERITAVRRAYETVPMIPALKHTLAAHYGTRSWRNPRPPLLPLSVEQVATLEAALAAVAFDTSQPESAVLA